MAELTPMMQQYFEIKNKNKDYILFYRLGDFYELHDYETKIENGMMVLVEIEKNVVCLFVDRLVGKQEIVVKPIPEYIKKVKGLSGCTQLGDGSIALILDAAGLMEY